MLSVVVDTRGVDKFLRGAREEFPKAINRGMKRLAGIYASEYLEGIKRAGINPWTGRSFSLIRS